MTIPSEKFSFDIFLKSVEDWVIGLTSLDVSNNVFNLNEKSINLNRIYENRRIYEIGENWFCLIKVKKRVEFFGKNFWKIERWDRLSVLD